MSLTLIFCRGLVYAVGEDRELTRLDLPAAFCGEVRRAAYVEPYGKLLRAIFRGLRRAFGDRGRVANFTRGWRCRWRVDARPSGGSVQGPFPDRESALDWEHTEVVACLRKQARHYASHLVFR